MPLDALLPEDEPREDEEEPLDEVDPLRDEDERLEDALLVEEPLDADAARLVEAPLPPDALAVRPSEAVLRLLLPVRLPLRPPPCDAAPPSRATRSRVALLADAKPLFEVPLEALLLRPEVEAFDVDVFDEERPDEAERPDDADRPEEVLRSEEALRERLLPDDALLLPPDVLLSLEAFLVRPEPEDDERPLDEPSSSAFLLRRW